MTPEESAELITAVRQVMEEVLMPELREMRAEVRAVAQRLEAFGTDSTQWLTPIDKRFERIDRQLNVYQDVQLLKKQMAELRVQQRPSA